MPTFFRAAAAALALLWLAGTAWAVPTLYPDHFNAGIRNRTASGYLADTRDPRRFYVLPPGNAAMTIAGLHTVTANVGFCREIADLQKYNLDTLALINSMKTRDNETQARLTRDRQKLAVLTAELGQYAAQAGLEQVAALDAQIRRLELRLDHLYDRYRTCTLDCGALARDIQQSQTRRAELIDRRQALAAENFAAALDYDRRRSAALALENSVRQTETDWRQLRADLLELYTLFNRMFDAHAGREGGRVSVLYDSGWSRNVETLRRDNPGYSFERIPTRNAALMTATGAGTPGGALLSFQVAGGTGRDGALLLPAYPEAVTGQAVLNLLGVCPLLHPEWFTVPAGGGLSAMSYGLTASYDYPSAMKYEVTATYNLYRMYQLIKTQGESGGFFSSHSWSEQDEQLFFQDAFRVDWKIPHDLPPLTAEQKSAITADLRRQVMSRLAAYLVRNDPGALPAVAGAPGSTGAQVLADSLGKTCPQNLYCQGASVVLNVLQAVFGASSTSQTLRQTLDVRMVDQYTDETVVQQPMLTTYH